MQCPKCGGSPNEVLKTRAVGQHSTRRRQRCTACDARFTTVEEAIGTEDGVRLSPDEQRQLTGL